MIDWHHVDEIVDSIPPGRWASYGDVAIAAGLTSRHAQAVGRYLADADIDNAHRVLHEDGRPSPRFRFGERHEARDIPDLIAELKGEGVRFDHLDRARDHCRLHVYQLRRLASR